MAPGYSDQRSLNFSNSSKATFLFVQKILGHADIGTTMNIYTDVTKDFEKKGMEKFDEYINGVSTNYGSLVVPVSRG